MKYWIAMGSSCGSVKVAQKSKPTSCKEQVSAQSAVAGMNSLPSRMYPQRVWLQKQLRWCD
ncbi:hypothetical protein PsexTeo8_61600 (plasmid) [Pseudomonas extremaustralis]|nr:hypothetical protein [Pseudomonas extremaustralis]